MQVHKAGCFAVIFTSRRNAEDGTGYEEMAQRMVALAQTQPGFLGIDGARAGDGVGVTVSYWERLEDIEAWRRNGEHLAAQAQGKARWYEAFSLHICRVERAYGFLKPRTQAEELSNDSQ